MAHQAPLPMGFSRQEYWSGVPLPSPPDGASGKELACQCKSHESRVRSLGGEYPLEEGMATHPSILCLENPMDRGACRVAKGWIHLFCDVIHRDLWSSEVRIQSSRAPLLSDLLAGEAPVFPRPQVPC